VPDEPWRGGAPIHNKASGDTEPEWRYGARAISTASFRSGGDCPGSVSPLWSPYLHDLRHLVVGRNNWLVFASPKGGEVACRLYSLVLSCKQNGVDPEAYIEDVLMKVATTPASKIATLTPWGWKAARQADASSD